MPKLYEQFALTATPAALHAIEDATRLYLQIDDSDLLTGPVRIELENFANDIRARLQRVVLERKEEAQLPTDAELLA